MMFLRGVLSSWLLCLLLVPWPGCNPLRQGPGDDGDGGGGNGDGGGGPNTYVNPAGCSGTFCDDKTACSAGHRCVQNVCFPNAGTCKDDNTCEDDTRCYMGACIPWDACTKLPHNDPTCQGPVFTPDQFRAPTIACHYGGVQSLSVPVVADLDKDGKPEIITIVYPDTILAIHGDCSLYWSKPFNLLSGGQGSVAVADLDGDGFPEIVAVDAGQHVMVIDHLGNLLATSPTPVPEISTYGQQLWSAPAIVNVDGVGPPEIVAGAQVSRFLRTPNPHIDVLWSHPNKTAWWGSLPIAADLDGDGLPEIISSDKIYDGITGADKTPPGLSTKPFYAQVADFNGDKSPDLLLVESAQGSQLVSIYDYKNKKTIFGPFGVAEGGWGGPAVIADFDGDKVPDFGLASAGHYFVYALKCINNPKPADCKGTDQGVLWEKQTEDASSGGTASSVFDFNGDGVAEVVYRDECWLRVYNGPDGKTLFAANITSNTALELPVVADVDNNGHADIVVTSDNFGACAAANRPEAETGTPWTGLTQGIFVLRDPMDRWVPSRGLWNQHSYHITNVNDDLSVPAHESNNWETYNNYRQNVQGGPMGGGGSQPDYTGHAQPPLEGSMCATEWQLEGRICNRGVGQTPVPVFGTFYDADPTMGGKAICTVMTKAQIGPGKCEQVACTWKNPPQQSHDIWFRVGDDNGVRQSGECKDGNDTSVLRNAMCVNGPG